MTAPPATAEPLAKLGSWIGGGVRVMDDAFKRTGMYSQRPPPTNDELSDGQSEIAGQARNDKERPQ